ncbi:MAG: HAD family hydrolase [Caldisericia bacterium]|nr:HAD family hydrolase [Caldisericia bacterium]
MENSLENKFLGCIFDIDGTLTNSIPEIAISVNTVLAKYNRTLYSEKEFHGFVGYGIENLIEKSFNIKKSDSNFLRIYKDVKKEYIFNFSKYAISYDGIEQVLSKLFKKNIKLGILSNKPDILAKKTAEYYFPKIEFSQVFGAIDNIPNKPNPTLLNSIIKFWGIDPKKVILIGDSTVDIQTAKASGIKSGAVSWGYVPRETLYMNDPDYIFEKPSDILDIF